MEEREKGPASFADLAQRPVLALEKPSEFTNPFSNSKLF
jgi:hypothetical protein